MAEDSVIVELLGQDKSLSSSLQGASASAQKFGRDIEMYVGNAERVMRDLDSSANSTSSIFSGALTGAIAGVAASLSELGIDLVVSSFKKLIAMGPELVDLANVQIGAETRLGAVLKATGNAAGFTLDQMKALASEVQANTKYGDEYVLGLQGVIATFRNVRGDEFKEATMLALDMATVLGGDAKGAAMQLGKALNDPIAGISALSRAGVTFTDQQKEMIHTLMESGDVIGAQKIILEELRGEFGGAAAADAKTFEGQMTQVNNTLGDIKETLGMAVIPLFEMFIPALKAGAAVAGRAAGEIKVLGEYIGNSTKVVIANSTVLKDWGDTAIAAIAVVKTSITNWQGLLEAAYISAKLGLVGFSEDFKYIFTNKLPAYVQWLGENWTKIFIDIGSFTGIVLNNLSDNLSNFFEALKSWLKGDGFDFEFTALTKGFESSLSELPEIAERKLSETEKTLQGRLAKIGTELAKSVSDDAVTIREEITKTFEVKPLEIKDTASSDYGPAPEGKKKGGGKSGSSFEELLALNTRISQSAAQFSDESKIPKKAGAPENANPNAKQEMLAEKQLDAAGKQVATTESVATLLATLIAKADTIISGLPLQSRAG